MAIYARISQDREGAGVKVERQVKDCSGFAEGRGWSAASELVFTDNDVSAYKSRRVRKGYRALCQAIEAGQVDAVVVYHADRLHRSNLELEEFIALIERTGVPVYSVSGGDYDLSTSDGRFMARVVGAAARKESEDKARRIRRKQLEKAERGEYHGGGRRPFGYGGAPLLDKHGAPVLRSDGTPIMDYRVIREDEAELIREAARRVLEGESTWGILRDWTARGVPTPGGGPWNNRSLTQILTSARVAGLRSHHGSIVSEKDEHDEPKQNDDGTPVYKAAEWPAILSVDVMMALRTKLGGQSEPVGRRPTYLLSGLVYCPCGSKMRSQSIRGRRRYTCISGPSGGCGKVSRDAERLERFVGHWVVLVAGFLGHGGRRQRRENPELATIDTLLGKLEDDRGDGTWTKEQYLRQRARLEARRDAAQASVVAEERQAGWRRLGVGGWWDDASTPFDQRRGLVLDLVDRVIVHPVGRGYRGDCTWTNTSINWTPQGQLGMDKLVAQAEADATEAGA